MRIVIATGGSGGHIFPALSAAEELRSRGHDMYFVGVFGSFAEKIRAARYPMLELPARGLFGRSPRALCSFIGAMVRSIAITRKFFLSWHPQVVVGFGGYGAAAPVVAAVLAGCPSVIHEQNVVPGKANRLLSRMARKIGVSFAESAGYFPSGKVVVTGCPVRAVPPAMEQGQARRVFGLKDDRLTLLVLGGSQGSRKINDAVSVVVPLLQQVMPVQLIHLAGRDGRQGLEEFYRSAGVPCAVLDFCDDMTAAYSAADLVIARSGAATVTEIALFQRPAVLIPYPFAGGHQRYNAEVLGRRRAAVVIAQEDLSLENLRDAILKIVRDPGMTDPARLYEGAAYPDAASRLADCVEDLRICV